MVPASPVERRLHAKALADLSWAVTPDRAARTAKARVAFENRFLEKADPEGVLPEAERARRAASLRKAYYANLAVQSLQARRRTQVSEQ